LKEECHAPCTKEATHSSSDRVSLSEVVIDGSLQGKIFLHVPDLDFQLHMSWFVFIFNDLRAGCLLGDIGGIVDHHCSITGILSSLGWSTFIP
jgi:hypothetical protein